MLKGVMYIIPIYRMFREFSLATVYDFEGNYIHDSLRLFYKNLGLGT